MTTYAFPSSPIPSALSWQLLTNTQAFTSPLNNTVQTLELAGARWAATLNFTNLTETQARPLIAFLAKLRGMANRATVYDHSYTVQGVATGTPRVKGASQTGASLITDGWTFSTTNILKAGDLIGVNSELHMVVADVNSDSGGNATLTIEPPLRSSPADNDTITVTNPTAVMRLVDDSQNSWSVGLAKFYNLQISFIESFT